VCCSLEPKISFIVGQNTETYGIPRSVSKGAEGPNYGGQEKFIEEVHLGFCLLNEFENGVFCYCCCYYLELKEWGVLLRDLDKAYRIFQNCYYCLEFEDMMCFTKGFA